MAYRGSSIEPKWLLVGAFFIAGSFFGGLYMYLYANMGRESNLKLHPAHGAYRYVNPTIATEPSSGYGTFSTVSRDLDLKINGIVNDAEKQGDVESVGIYFRDLEPGKWLAINSDVQFSPGVLLKIPVMMTYFKLAQESPDILNDSIHFSGPAMPNDNLLAHAKPLQPGDYTVNELIEKMIKDSDETSAALLFDHVDKNTLGEVFSDLGIDFQEDKTTRDFISIKRYSLFYRALYSASYLSPDYSDRALSLLAEGRAHSLLQQSLPRAVDFIGRVSVRRFLADNKNMYEAYECDLVYYQDHNYILCATARSATMSNITRLFDKIGSSIYEDMLYQYGK